MRLVPVTVTSMSEVENALSSHGRNTPKRKQFIVDNDHRFGVMMSHLEPLMQRNFWSTLRAVVDRAIPELRDGCKPVQRRILHTLFDGRW